MESEKPKTPEKNKNRVQRAISRTVRLFVPHRKKTCPALPEPQLEVDEADIEHSVLNETIEMYTKSREIFPNLPQELRTEQIHAIDAIRNGKNALVLLRAGFGKSLIIYIPGLLRLQVCNCRQLTVIVSPLIALIDDSLSRLNYYGLFGIHFVGDELELRNFIGSEDDLTSKYIFISPELLKMKGPRDLLIASKPFLMAVDEGHLVSEWGKDFRKDYGSVFEFAVAAGCQVGVFTATLPTTLMQEVKEKSGLTDDNLFVLAKSPDRGNIFIDLRKPSIKLEQIDFLIDELKEKKETFGKTLICVLTPKTATDLFFYFQEKLGDLGVVLNDRGLPRGFVADMYTASTEAAYKPIILSEFKSACGITRVLIATVAFGLGVDIPNIRRIVIFGLPRTKMLLVQELGRGGRDGLQATGIIFPFKGRVGKDEVIEYEIPSDKCIREFLLEDYTVTSGSVVDMEGRVLECEKCSCCSFCANKCSCTTVGSA